MDILLDKSHLKSVLMSKRANIYYLEHCKVIQNGGRVEYITQDKNKQAYWNIPIANTTVVLLGCGTSITQAAIRMLAAAGVAVGFCGGGGSPLFAGNEVEFISPQSEYRPTEYVQRWLSFWFKPAKRLEVAKYFQCIRLENIKRIWNKEKLFEENGIFTDDSDFENFTKNMAFGVDSANSVQTLLEIEGRTTKRIYAFIARSVGYIDDFKRDNTASDFTNIFLNHGNYLAYGLAATALWTLGIPHSFAVMHGKTRRGALVFDVADLFKDAIVLPTAFICAQRGDSDKEFRETLMDLIVDKHDVLNGMIETIKEACNKFGEDSI